MSDSDCVLLLTRREQVRAQVDDIAARAGVSVVTVAPGDGAAALPGSRLLVDAALVAELSPAAHRRCSTLSVVGLDTADPQVWRWALAAGAGQVLQLPGDAAALLDIVRSSGSGKPDRGWVVAVIGGCGGAGASTFAVGLAICAARTGHSSLVDLDPLAGGLDVLLGAEQLPGARWADLAGARGRLPGEALLATLVKVHGLHLLSMGRDPVVDVPAAATAAVVEAIGGASRTSVLDLPRWPDEHRRLVLAAADQVLVVVPATLRAVAATARFLVELTGQSTVAGLVVRDAGPGTIRRDQVERHLGVPVVAGYDSDPAVRAAASRGESPVRQARGGLAAACHLVLDNRPVAAA
jgi:secretion/DNA translocation related CpaE-like protein